MNFFVGLDWASQAHAVCVLDATGQVCWQGSVEHSADGLAELLRRPLSPSPSNAPRVSSSIP